MTSFLIDVQRLKTGLIIFRRADVEHRNWYCRIKVPGTGRYKTISLKTADINDAKDKAFDHDADVRFRLRHQVPVFDKPFAEVAKEYSDFQKRRFETGQITRTRWRILDSYIRNHLIPYIGNKQITQVGEDQWNEYPFWRKQNSQPIQKPTKGHLRRPPKAATPEGAIPDEDTAEPAKAGTIKQEMIVFKAIMNFAADKNYIQQRQVPKGDLPTDKARREEFTLPEYRQLHTYARKWIEAAESAISTWYRTMAYNFMLVMTNTGMRTIEAKNLKWQDIEIRTDKHHRRFAVLSVRGKNKYRKLVAAQNVADYLHRIRAISKATEPGDRVFTTYEGEPALTLFSFLIKGLLTESGLLTSSTGSRRSTYCFRHTYATFRLMEGVDVYFLARQMGTSVQMIEDYYGHIEPDQNAERILQGVPGWEPNANSSRETSDEHAEGADKGARRRSTSKRGPARSKRTAAPGLPHRRRVRRGGTDDRKAVSATNDAE